VNTQRFPASGRDLTAARIYSFGYHSCRLALPARPHMLDAAIRLLELGALTSDAALFAPHVMDEILIRLLRSPLGLRLARIGSAESSTSKVATAIAWLRANFAQSMRVEELASLAHMSVSAFHQYFKSSVKRQPETLFD